MSDKKQLRKAFFVDPIVQGDLLRKAATAWLMCLSFVGTLTLLGWFFITPGLDDLIIMREQLPALIGMMVMSFLASVIVLPILFYDLIKLTNRFAGPVYRLEQRMKAVANGASVEKLSFRNEDYWQGLAEAFNGMVDRIESNTLCTDEEVSSEIESEPISTQA